MKTRVVVGLSGGVDSSVAAWLLREQGYEVIGVTLWLYDDRGTFRKTCCGVEAIRAARKLARHLGIPHYVVDLRETFRGRIIQAFVEGYRRGETPNVCLACNRWFKFGWMLSFARDMGAEWIATGHFARVDARGELYRALDDTKDQSYFLALVPREVLRRTLFPVGTLTKAEVRRLAREHRLPTATRIESQEICFTEGNTRAFLRRHLSPRPGTFVDLEGRVVGRHPGAELYTIGQRKGLGVALGYRVYVVDRNPETRTVVLGPREAVWVERLFVEEVGDRTLPEGRRWVRVRSTHAPAPAEILRSDGGVWIHFEEPVWPPAPGQYAVVYAEDDRVEGVGVIKELVRKGGDPWRKPSTAKRSLQATGSTSST